MNGKKAKRLRRRAKELLLEAYKDMLPEGTEVTTEEAIKYAPQLWKRLCAQVKKKNDVTLEELKPK